MKNLSDDMTAHLESGATTLCWCWRVARRDGTVLGFTDHDRDVTFGGVTYEAESGLSATELQESVGLSVDNLDVTGALTSDRLTPEDLAAGLYDDAAVDVYRVNWTDTDQHVLMRSGSLGEVKRGNLEFVAEVRGLAHYLQQPNGRLLQYSCDADLGDHRCRVDLTASAYRVVGGVTDVIHDRKFAVDGLAAQGSDWFTRGLLTFTGGANPEIAIEVKHHVVDTDTVTIELWRAPPRPAVVGDTFVLTAGCDKQIAMCANKFSNAANFRGFPNIPGTDLLIRAAGS
ncbi:MAG: DUF2163 domain-containing protein [Pseudomonadota bacterium]